jgi:hypothetical protein
MPLGSDETTRVIIHTASRRIEGSIALLPGARLTDYVRSVQSFVAITDATVYDATGERLFSADFLDVGVDGIELILPASSLRR